MNQPETKAFYKTTEFWGHLVAQILLWAGALPTGGLPSWGTTAISFAGLMGYGVSRGLAKSGSPFNIGATLSAVLHDNTSPDTLPQVGTSDIQPSLPGGDAAGLKGVDAPPASAAQAETLVQEGVTDLAKLADTVRHIASEHPEVVNQLKAEGVL
jgi:hypothetical protein